MIKQTATVGLQATLFEVKVRYY